MNSEFDIVILAAGKGTRMGQVDTPKVLVELAGKPLIQHVLSRLQHEPSFPAPIVVVGFGAERVKSVVGSSVHYIFQSEQLGTGHAVMCARPEVASTHVVVLYGDMPFITSDSIRKLMDAHMSTGSPLSMFTTTVPHFQGAFEPMVGFGRIIRNQFGSIQKITEYKDATDEEKKIHEVNPGIYAFSTEWLWKTIDRIKNNNAQQEYYLTDMVELAIQDHLAINGLAIDPHEVFGINTPDQLALAETLLRS